jgi:hypothetical protein
LLSPLVIECAFSTANQQKPVDQNTFIAHHFLGEEKIELTWRKPCPEVSGYELKWTGGGEGKIILPSNALNFILTTPRVEWNGRYRYEIKAIFSDGPRTDEQKLSSAPAILEVAVGDEECERRPPHDFCFFTEPSPQEAFPEFFDQPFRKIVYFCTEENQLTIRIQCEQEFSFCVEQGIASFAALICHAAHQRREQIH